MTQIAAPTLLETDAFASARRGVRFNGTSGHVPRRYVRAFGDVSRLIGKRENRRSVRALSDNSRRHQAIGAIADSVPPPPPASPAWVSRTPPSGDRARLFTLLSAFWLWFLLPVAIYYQRKARREVEASNGFYEWPRTLLNRPIALFLVVLAATLALVMVMVVIGIYGDPGGA